MKTPVVDPRKFAHDYGFAMVAPTADDTALGYATRLAVLLWERHWKANSPHWKALPDLLGVLTQIDNMTASLIKRCDGCDGHECWSQCAYPGAARDNEG